MTVSNWRSAPPIFTRQWFVVSSTWVISSTSSRKCGKDSNWVHWLYAVFTGTFTSMDSVTAAMSAPFVVLVVARDGRPSLGCVQGLEFPG